MQDLGAQKQPLAGTHVMVTRPVVVEATIADPLAEQLQALGAVVIAQPAIRIEPPADWQPVDKALARLREYDWIVFSSANGVRSFIKRAAIRSTDAFPRLAAIGPGTAEELARHGLRADRVPDEFRAEALAETLTPDAAGKRFLLARASRGRDVLARRLREAGAEVDEIVVYASVDVERPDAEAAALLRAGRIDWITVTSSAIARSLVRMFGDQLRHARLASISPITSDVLRELGYSPEAEAAEYTLTGLVAAMSQGHRNTPVEGRPNEF